MPMVLWINYLLESQVCSTDTYILQDNQSYMLLDSSWIDYSGKINRHINIRYFFILDRVKYGDTNTKYYPTDDMIGDFFTKPLQISKLSKFIDQTLNAKSRYYGSNTTDGDDPQECVRY